jgi:transposase
MKAQTKQRERRKYDEQFKKDAVQMIENGQSVRTVAEGLGVAENLLHKWKREIGSQRSEVEVENAELRARLRQVEQERDILKKALSIFSRQS